MCSASSLGTSRVGARTPRGNEQEERAVPGARTPRRSGSRCCRTRRRGRPQGRPRPPRNRAPLSRRRYSSRDIRSMVQHSPPANGPVPRLRSLCPRSVGPSPTNPRRVTSGVEFSKCRTGNGSVPRCGSGGWPYYRAPTCHVGRPASRERHLVDTGEGVGHGRLLRCGNCGSRRRSSNRLRQPVRRGADCAGARGVGAHFAEAGPVLRVRSDASYDEMFPNVGALHRCARRPTAPGSVSAPVVTRPRRHSSAGTRTSSATCSTTAT